MQVKDFNLQLAKAIKDGIAKSQAVIAKHNAKEQNGLAKLNKTLGQNDPALTGAGGELSAGSAMTGVPNLARNEYKPKIGRGEDKGISWRNLFLLYPSSLAAKKNNTRAEYEAQKIEKGVLPEGGGPGVPGGISDMNNNADAGFGASEKKMSKGELDGDVGSCSMCMGPLHALGTLGNLLHVVCRNCGTMSSVSQPREENTEAKESEAVDPTVSKAELAKVCPPGEKKLTDKLKDEYGHSGAGEGKAIATAWKIHDKKVEKGESCASTPMKKEEISNTGKEVPMTNTIAPEKVKGAKTGTETIPDAIKTDGSGDITKGKVAKGALVEHVKNAAKKAGVPVKDVLGYKVPKTLQTVSPPHNPNFNKGALDGGVAREPAIKTGRPVIPGKFPPKIGGGVQTQVAAVKKPLIPMVNTGVVAKAEKHPCTCWHCKSWPGGASTPSVYAEAKTGHKKPFSTKAAKAFVHKERNDKRAEYEASKVEKAESPAAKPIAKSPASGSAAKVSAPKMPTTNMAPKAPKL
jgi:hypothetical protein